MAKRKIISHVMIGAAVGAVIALLDKDTRSYTKQKIMTVKDQVNDIKEHPEKAVRTIRTAVERVNRTLASGSENVLTTLDKVENKLGK